MEQGGGRPENGNRKPETGNRRTENEGVKVKRWENEKVRKDSSGQ
jgi:hypothetical protein